MTTYTVCAVCGAPLAPGHQYEFLTSVTCPPPMPAPLTESDVRRIVREELASKNSWLIERRPDSGEADV